MRTISHEYWEKIRNGNNAFATILNTPKPDFTELDKDCKKFEEWSLKQQEEDRKIIREALRNR